jgi:D-aminoacyl-tRNA deacylase
MRAVIQRVSHASVTVDDAIVGAIGPGLVILLGVGADDVPTDATYLVDKITNMRIFPDAANNSGRFDRSALDVNAELLLISQFTLYADTRKGRRPSFTGAARPEVAAATFDDVVERFKQTGLTVQTGVFQAHMDVTLTNDGPVTITLDTANARPGARERDL